MIRLIPVFFCGHLLLFFFSAFGQEPQIDSLRQKYAQPASASEKIEIAFLIATEFRSGKSKNIDSSLWWYEHSLRLSRTANEKEWACKSLLELGELLATVTRDDFPRSIRLLEEALSLSEQVGNDELKYSILILLGSVNLTVGNMQQTLSYCLAALGLLDTTQFNFQLAKVYELMGGTYSKLGRFSEAIEYLEKSMEVGKSIDYPVLYIYNSMGITYKKIGAYGKALGYYEKALAIAEAENHFMVIPLLHNMGNILEITEEFTDGLNYQYEALNLCRERKAGPQFEGWILKSIGSAYLNLNQLDSAIRFATASFKIGCDLPEYDMSKQAAEILTQVYKEIGNFQKAYEYQKHFKSYSDSLVNRESIRKIAELESQYKFKRERELRDLEVQQKEELFQAQLSQQRTWRNSLILGIIGVVIFAIIIYRNYLEKKKSTEALEESNALITRQAKDLKKLNTAKNRFFSIISHDLRAPMNIFHGMSFLIKSYLKEKEYQELEEYADDIRDTATQVSQLLDNLLTWAVKEEGNFPFEQQTLDLRSCVEENLSIFTSLAAAKNIDFESELSEDVEVWADKNSIMTILRNLISNALKFTPEGGSVKITINQTNDYGILSVTDTGIGLSKEKLKTLFKAADRQLTYGTSGERGVGLGMQLVHDFVEMNHGKIEVESQPEKGSKFLIFLPRQQAA